MTISNQMMKGLLDGAILALIAQGETYGYEILEKLKEKNFPEISDGSIYPVLLRLSKKAYIQSETRKSDTGGPRRKYYTITQEGQTELDNFRNKWFALNQGMNNLLRSDKDVK
ncbi:PadR family transcriptional regulator [Staphylococcus simulans]|uniref:PadR family transcriptional regulator n=1 Tax=Staphylococcus simulans TaxID=1286 RepID=UPI000D028955|nr:PadR family transcriptional regulator [Staphylococcus simulans]MCD8915899.1 PadR family transcriptional regulator [Staphylococcus simulans]